eukprot:TRINITY_DN8109_c0_g2_i11.p2 TRINITY_DN8109_c0_g2~~TRINITY_DN8109_c0_g2_i11.p2  ORF type:complete len:230 (+),score=39.15 TRINITY_DN8109_c0_g2_i11:132-821(+)
MKILGWVTLLVFATAVFASTEDPIAVALLTEANFDSLVINSTQNWFIMFHAPWCPHCVRLKPTWADLTTEVSKFNVRMAWINCDDNPLLKDRFAITGFPTLLYFSNGKYYEYSGKRDLELLANFAKGGYKTVSAEDIPTQPSSLRLFWRIFVKSIARFVDMFETNPTLAWGIVAAGIVMMVLSCCISEWIVQKMERKYAPNGAHSPPRTASASASEPQPVSNSGKTKQD